MRSISRTGLPAVLNGIVIMILFAAFSTLPALGQYLIPNGTYYITNKATGQVIDDYGKSTSDGQDVDEYTLTSATNQQWTLTNLGNNYVKLINVYSGLALEVYQGLTTANAAINQNAYSGATDQIWLIVSKGNGEYYLQNQNSGLVIDDPASNTTPGTFLQQYGANNGSNQLWSFTSTTPTLIANGTYYITNKATGQVIDDYGKSTSDGQDVDEYTLTNTTNQQWTLTNLGNNYVKLINVYSGLALEVYEGLTTANAAIDQNAYSGATDQIWLIVSEGSGEYYLQNQNSGLVIDDPASNTTPGTFLQQYGANNGNNQLWAFSTVSSGGGATPNITVNGSSSVGYISSNQLGVNLGTWASANVNSSSPSGPYEVGLLGTKFIRWPGGSYADDYHWAGQNENNPGAPTNCYISNSNTRPYTYASSGASTNNDWPNYQNDLAQPGGYTTAVTVNYGTNPACNGGGDPNEAAAWVANAKTNGYNVAYWTVGNEEYGSWEDDLHSYSPAPSDGTGGHSGYYYASLMQGSGGWYQKMKAANSSAQVGAIIELEALNASDAWNAAVLGCSNATGATTCGSTTSGAQFDYLELHDYAQTPGQESDSYLLNGAISDFDSTISMLRAELTATGHSVNTPIFLGEFNSVYGNVGKQSASIVNGLYVAEMYGHILTDGVNAATLWFGTGGSQGCGNNNSSSLYGWQKWGAYDGVANNVSSNWTNCGSGPNVPEATVFPSGQAVNLANQFAHNGEHMLTNSVSSSLSYVRDFSASNGTGYNHMLINLDPNNSYSVTVGVSNSSRTSFTGKTVTYGKTQYDQSQYNEWPGPVTTSLGTVGANVTISLPPYSITVLEMQ